MIARRWIIGRGLLGNAIARSRSDEPYRVATQWDDDTSIRAQLRSGLVGFLAPDRAPVEIYWCAGKGVTSTPAEQLGRELAVFESFLSALRETPAEDRTRVSFFLASSVGGAYGRSEHPPFTESTPAVPASAYGAAKLAAESLLREATGDGGWRSLIGRVTNLYGPGQDLGKGQGLISAIVGSSITQRPVSIYVSLDTLRDYIYEDDCADVVSAGMERISQSPAGTTVTKIMGGMTAISISAILAEHNRLRKRRTPIILGSGDARGQSLDLRVRSEVWTDLDGLVRTPLSEGLDAVFRAQLAGWAR